ncbi:hypothetical protein TNCV_2957371 [Trichonephila clavipes]|nr:hypothetical protein TNCV_2957371 [Trichonephila clavipes]
MIMTILEDVTGVSRLVTLSLLTTNLTTNMISPRRLREGSRFDLDYEEDYGNSRRCDLGYQIGNIIVLDD